MSPLSIAVLQSPLHWHDASANREMFQAQLESLRPGVELVVLPEMFSSGFTMQPELVAESMQGASISWLQQMAQRFDLAICASLVIEESGQYSNRFVFCHPDGTLECYDKRHLFRMAGEHQHYRQGEKRTIIEYRGWKILAQVCFDLRFPVFSRNRNDYDLAIYVANWPAPRRHHWRTLLQARAIENLCYVVGVNRGGSDDKGLDYSGDSMVVDFRGELLNDVDPGTEAVLYQQLDSKALADYRAQFPAHLDADPFRLEM